MIHIFKNKSGKFDQVTVRAGRFIQGSNQGYENKRDLLETIIEDLQEVRSPSVGHNWRKVQDDTPRTSVMLKVWSNGTIETMSEKPGKKYRVK